MKINTITTNQNFKGYKNLFADNLPGERGENFAFVAMQLNNEKNNDLDKWIEIQKLIDPTEAQTDIIFFHQSNIKNKDYFTIGNTFLNLDKIDEPKIESIKMKAFTLMANLTKEIITAAYHPNGENKHLVLAELIKKLNGMLKNDFASQTIAYQAAMGKTKEHVVAELINSKISKNMYKYLKL